MVFHTDLQRFVTIFKERLGPQICNVPLLYQGTPELRDVLMGSDVPSDPPEERLATTELRARFQSLVEHVFAVIAETRLFALFLDDLHEADQSCVIFFFDSCVAWVLARTLDLVSTLVNSRSRMVGLIIISPYNRSRGVQLIFITIRSDKMWLHLLCHATQC